MIGMVQEEVHVARADPAVARRAMSAGRCMRSPDETHHDLELVAHQAALPDEHQPAVLKTP